METNEKLSSVLSGVAGEYYVAGELSRLGYIASITLRNTKGVDILAANSDTTKSIGIQVKTTQSSVKSWVLNQKAEQDTATNLFFVFVNLNDGQGSPTFHVVPSQVVSEQIITYHAEWLAGTKKDGRERKDTPMRKFRDANDQYLNRWDLLGL